MILCSRIRWHVFGLGLLRNTKPKLPNQLSWTVNYFGVDVREHFDATIGMTTMISPPLLYTFVVFWRDCHIRSGWCSLRQGAGWVSAAGNMTRSWNLYLALFWASRFPSPSKWAGILSPFLVGQLSQELIFSHLNTWLIFHMVRFHFTHSASTFLLRWWQINPNTKNQ